LMKFLINMGYMKTCFKCNKKKKLNLFHRHPKMKDGHLNKCKECVIAYTKNYYCKNNDKIKKKDRERDSRPERVAARKLYYEKCKNDLKLQKRNAAYKKKWQENNKEKRAAHILTGNAIRRGILIRKPCEVCGKKKVEAHHNDYIKPLEVRWLCKKHHVQHHKQLRGNT
jgi:hypothetical protein